MRALLVVNPVATTTTPRTRDVIASALESELKVDVVVTEHRGHAAELARAAKADSLDVVVSLGGDGTVNEIVNGLLGEGTSADGPTLAVVPGGSTNVFARALGIPDDPIEATGQILEAARERRFRRVGLGRADDRWFTFSAGLGLDAEVVAAVEQRRRAGARSTPALYIRTAIREFYRRTERRKAPLILERPGQEPIEGIFLALIQNTAPWTYLGRRAVHPSPRASFDTGLDVFALRRLSTLAVTRHSLQLLDAEGRGPRGRSVFSLHDAPEFTMRSTQPIAFQLDGEHLGTTESMTFTSVPRALPVLV